MWGYAFSQFGMEDADKVDEEKVGTERRLLEVGIAHAWQTLVHLTLLESTQQAIALVLGKQLAGRKHLLATAHKQPAVGIGCLVYDLLWRERQRTTMPIVGKDVIATGIGYEFAHAALASRTIPRATDNTLGYDTGLDLRGARQLAPLCIVALHFLKQRVGLLLSSDKRTVEPHPLGTAKCGGLHILGTLY